MSHPLPLRSSRRSLAMRARPMLAGALLALPAVAVFGSDAGAAARPTTVYTQSNAAAGNQVLAFRSVNGTFSAIGSYPTGGLGSGKGLGSQGAVIAQGGRLLAVNAGSDELSVFAVRGDGTLRLADVEPTGGDRPVSIAEHGDVVYVLNAGDETVSGFRLQGGDLMPIQGSHQQLTGAGAAQISFTADGGQLVVTQKASNTIEVLEVNQGVAEAPVSHASVGATPFGFAIDRQDHVIVSNAAGGALGASSLSSYDLSADGSVTVVSGEVATTQTAACWVALSNDEKFAFTTNAGSGSISSYAVGNNGSLTLRDATAAKPGAGPVDMAVQGGDLFTLNGGAHTVALHRVGTDGSLTAGGQVTVPAGVVGLAVS